MLVLKAGSVGTVRVSHRREKNVGQPREWLGGGGYKSTCEACALSALHVPLGLLALIHATAKFMPPPQRSAPAQARGSGAPSALGARSSL